MTPHELLLRFDRAAPVESATAPPAAWYTDPALWELERRSLFGGWQLLGSAERVATSGQYLTSDCAGEPVVLLRDGERLRALSNVCRHRAAVLLAEEAGSCHAIRCPYHGWTYDLAGQLRGAPESAGTLAFDRDAIHLPAYRADVWAGLAWLCRDRHVGPLAEALAPMPERSAAFDLGQMCWAERRVYRVACNWKVYVDNYLDGGYHVHAVHPELAGVLDYAHYRTELFETCNVQLSPLVTPASNSALAAVRTGGEAQYWWLFPNTMLNIYGGVMDTNSVRPLTPDACEVVFDFYFASGTSDEFIRESIAVADRVQEEDAAICARVQRGLGGSVYAGGRYMARREAGQHQFHRLLAHRLFALA